MNNRIKLLFVISVLFFGSLSCDAHGPISLDHQVKSEKEISIEKEKGRLSKSSRAMSIYTDNGIEFTFRRVEKDYIRDKTSFYDLWQLWEAFGSKEDGQRDIRIVRPGEWETALKIGNDFVGGINHGFERKTSVQFVLDGKTIAEDKDIALQSFKSFYVIQKSDLYAFNSTTEKIAHITKKWDFKENGMIELHQTINWLSAQSLNNSYLTMLPISREENGVNITSKAQRNDIKEVFDVSQEGHKNPLGPSGRNKESSSITVWGDHYKFHVTIERKTVLPNSSLWLSNAKIYNKVYFDYSGKHEVKKGEVFDLLARFEISKSE